MTHRPVRQLPVEVARKIAAGEVIDRPASILREMLDNAVDSGADTITAEISGGGIDEVCVSDNGSGMSKEDLAAAAHPHSTSKIVCEDDLRNLSTLGFRGEALASIAAVSRLTIVSRRQASDVAWKLTAPVAGKGDNLVTPATRAEGTTVRSQSLFEDIPARRLFLKRPATETAQCRQVFIEKALPFTQKTFRLVCDGKQRLDLPAGESLAERFTEAFEMSEPPELFSEVRLQDRTLSLDSTDGENFGDWRITLLLGDPAVSRSDRRHLLIYVNGRRIQEYSLLQAIEYGATGFFPNGTHPAAVLFLEMNPALVDFNIHPAKREVRFKDISAVHHAVSTAVRSHYVRTSQEKRDAVIENSGPSGTSAHEGISTGKSWQQPYLYQETRDSIPEPAAAQPSYSGSYGSPYRPAVPVHHEQTPAEAALAKAVHDTYGRASGIHGTQDGIQLRHKSGITYGAGSPAPAGGSTDTDGFSSNGSPALAGSPAPTAPVTEPGPVPEQNAGTPSFRYIGQIMQVFLAVEKDDTLLLIDQHAGHERILYDRFMAQAGKKQPLLINDCFETESNDDDRYIQGLLPALDAAGFELRSVESGIWEVRTIPATWQGTADDLYKALVENRMEPAELQRTLAAYTACRAAIKEGHYLDEATARSLAAEILALPDPHCPHGRPLWIALSRDDLYQLIKRT